jgi:hypothetical protein
MPQARAVEMVAQLREPGYCPRMRWHLFSSEAKKKLWRPCREARALGL